MALHTPTPSPAQAWWRATAPLVLVVALLAWGVVGLDEGLSHAARSKSKAKAKPPDLKILSVRPVPLPFSPAEAPLTLTIMVTLPKTLPDETLLDVTTLITSPSKLSIRLLTNRQMVAGNPASGAGDGSSEPRTVEVVQTWDGTDHMKRVVASGIYDYQVQAKLMVRGKNGPMTRATSWKKRGSFEVRAQ